MKIVEKYKKKKRKWGDAIGTLHCPKCRSHLVTKGLKGHGVICSNEKCGFYDIK